MPIDKLIEMWYNNNRNGEGITPKNQKGFYIMGLYNIFSMDLINGKTYSCFLTKEDMRTDEECVERLKDAIDKNMKMYYIIKHAAELVNNKKRNARIRRHEEIIETICIYLTANIPCNCYTTVEQTAKTIKEVFPLTSRSYTDECTGEIKHTIPIHIAKACLERLVKDEKMVKIFNYSGVAYYVMK